jgi:anhydro-N-acetylmuramic acid kinase
VSSGSDAALGTPSDRPLRVIGLISGTSVDRIEAAAADLDAERDVVTFRPLGNLGIEYPPELREAILRTLPPAATSMEEIARLDTLIGVAFADAAEMANDELAGGRADLVVSHGQNVFHWVEGGQARGTLQLGQPAWIAERTGLPVISNVRARDVAAGGHGAPLVSLFDSMLLGGGSPRAALNLGGIANITVVGRGRDPLAFDTGPANALMDGWLQDATGGAEWMDTDGARAARGSVNRRLLEELLADPYYALPPPKSTGRELFSLQAVRQAVVHIGVEPELDHMLATLATLTARTVADACRRFDVKEVVAAGGGTLNPTLMRMLRAELGEIPLSVIDDFGVPALAKEAYAFALIGFMTAHGWPGIVDGATGARHPSVLGSITPGRGRLWLPISDAAAPTRLVIA